MPIIDNPEKFADKFRVKSSRLNNWDYSSSGYYFVTICTLNHNNFFGKIIDNKMELSNKGKITNKCLLEIPNHFKNVLIDKYVIMPNHLHLLLKLSKLLSNLVETHHDASLLIKYNSFYYHRIAIRSSQTIPLVIKQFKSSVKRKCNKQKLFFAWQTRYFDEIIDSEKRLMIIKNYIKNNINNWEKDKYFLKNKNDNNQ